jgi:hypothetical protein
MVRLPIEQRDNGKGNDWGVTPLHTPGSKHERAVNSCATYVGQVNLLSTADAEIKLSETRRLLEKKIEQLAVLVDRWS